ncbi:hypothetical protein Scep_005206 [Stephania cephalantha]|uniref:Reverse transcriptase Ty1/copia-type domain-containing protein n=1 Tax=Stephania cephalantha TaxID=152367 RepID=A0AAP0PW52_9MAGN
MIFLYVDDIIYVGSSTVLIDEFKFDMMKTFEMTDLGLLHYFFGLEVFLQKRDGIFISQIKYATDLLKRFHMVNRNGVATPMNLNEKLQVDDDSGMANEKLFRSLVSVVSRFMHNPAFHGRTTHIDNRIHFIRDLVTPMSKW